MAKCERREIRPEPPPVEFVLTLTEDEALAVRNAFWGASSPELYQVFSALYNALTNGGK